MSQSNKQTIGKKDEVRYPDSRAWYSLALHGSLSDSEAAFRKLLALDAEGLPEEPQVLQKYSGQASGIATASAMALETLSKSMGCKPMSGACLSWGLVIELYLSMALLGFPKDLVRLMARASRDWYGAPDFTCKHYDRLFDLIVEANQGKLPLLAGAQNDVIWTPVEKDMLFEALDFLRESCGL